MASPPPGGRLRVLCLHSWRTSGSIFREQVRLGGCGLGRQTAGPAQRSATSSARQPVPAALLTPHTPQFERARLLPVLEAVADLVRRPKHLQSKGHLSAPLQPGLGRSSAAARVPGGPPLTAPPSPPINKLLKGVCGRPQPRARARAQGRAGGLPGQGVPGVVYHRRGRGAPRTRPAFARAGSPALAWARVAQRVRAHTAPADGRTGPPPAAGPSRRRPFRKKWPRSG
jgi:hypothetical protein